MERFEEKLVAADRGGAWIEEAKRADTRSRRVAGTLDRLAGEPTG